MSEKVVKELITKCDGYFHPTNDLTVDMDTYLKHPSIHMKTYINEDLFEHGYAIRYPGATRGYVKFDENNIITKIELYRDGYNIDKIYKDNVRECFAKYIGMKLVMIPYKKGDKID